MTHPINPGHMALSGTPESIVAQLDAMEPAWVVIQNPGEIVLDEHPTKRAAMKDMESRGPGQFELMRREADGSLVVEV